jgi:hypothetical protein
MRKRKVLQNDELLYVSNIIRISKESNGDLFFEIGTEITTDISEAVSILMKNDVRSSEIWEFEVDKINLSIDPEKSLYWLTGGHKEWRNLENYNRPWSQCYLDYQEEFGSLISNIIKRSKKLKDIRDGFQKYLNLPNLYEFALSKKFIR